MLWLLALYPILLTTSFSQAQNPSQDEENTISISNPSTSLEMMVDPSSIPITPLNDANKLAFSPTPLDDTLKILGDLPGTTNQQTQSDIPPGINSPESPFPQIPFDAKQGTSEFNQALLDGDTPSFPLLDLLQGIPSNTNIPSSGEGSSEEKPTDPNPVEPGAVEQPRYDPQERVENPTPPECDEGRLAMCCNEGPANAGPAIPREQVWHKRRLCKFCTCFPQRKSFCRCFLAIHSFSCSPPLQPLFQISIPPTCPFTKHNTNSLPPPLRSLL